MKKLNIAVSLITLFLAGCSSTVNKIENKSTSNDNNKSDNKSIVITISTFGNNYEAYLKDYAEKFNSENNGYQVVFKDYGEATNIYDDSPQNDLSEFYNSTDENLSLDIMKGNTIDIIPKSAFQNAGRYEELAAKGAFTDLYVFLDNDTEINRSTLFEQVLTAFETDGKLYTMPECFQISTLAGYSKYVGDKENWTFQELMDHWNNMPVEATFDGGTNSDGVYRCILQGYINQFFDLAKGEVYFDSPEFIDALKFCNTFSAPEEYKTDNNSAEKFLFPVEMMSFENYHMYLLNDRNDEVTFVGYPTSDGCGSFISAGSSEFAISALSSPEVQEGAWKFMRTFLDYDYQYERYGFPINKNAFEDKGEYAVKNSKTETRTRQGIEYTRKAFTEDEYQRLLDFIPTVTKKQNTIDGEIYKVIDEEIMTMLYGEKNEKETAIMIQNRVSILVSEKY